MNLLPKLFGVIAMLFLCGIVAVAVYDSGGGWFVDENQVIALSAIAGSINQSVYGTEMYAVQIPPNIAKLVDYDLNNDGAVDLLDLAIMAEGWMTRYNMLDFAQFCKEYLYYK